MCRLKPKWNSFYKSGPKCGLRNLTRHPKLRAVEADKMAAKCVQGKKSACFRDILALLCVCVCMSGSMQFLVKWKIIGFLKINNYYNVSVSFVNICVFFYFHFMWKNIEAVAVWLICLIFFCALIFLYTVDNNWVWSMFDREIIFFHLGITNLKIFLTMT